MRPFFLSALIATMLWGELALAAQRVVEYEKPFASRSFAGTIVDSNGAPVERAVVEECDAKWDSCFGRVQTDLNGNFSFPKNAAGKHFLRISKDGFTPAWITLIVNKRSNKQLSLKLYVAT